MGVQNLTLGLGKEVGGGGNGNPGRFPKTAWNGDCP